MPFIKPFRLPRRSFLKGAGVAVALPYMECMAQEKQTLAIEQRSSAPKRMTFIYVPNGVGIPGLDSDYADWHWFPKGEGKEFEFTTVLNSLTPFKQDLSVIGGLSHPKSRELLGHLAGDTFLTGGDVGGKYNNSISVDQVAVAKKKLATRYPSLNLSGDGGVGFKSRVSTLSFDSRGIAIPSEHQHRRIFERYFSLNGKEASLERKRSLVRQQKMVDLVLEESKRLQKKLGASDKLKLDEHLAALSQLEEQIKRNEAWLNIPLKSFDATHLDLAVDAKVDPQSYIRTMLDLIVLAYQIDLTEVATYMIGREDGMGIADHYPSLALGIKKGHHQISHDKTEGHWEEWGKYDQWLASHLSYFLDRMKNTHDEFGPLLDNTQVLYGSACSDTHNARNYPLILAGGKHMGLQHGRYTRFDESVPLSDLFVHMLRAADVDVEHFSDSSEVLTPMPLLFS